MDGPAANERTNLLGLPKAELVAFVAEMGSKPFRARQLMNWLYKRGEGDIAAMTDLAKDFRAELVLRAEVLGEVGHRRDVTLAALVQPVHELPGAEGFAAQLADERFQLGLGQAEQVDAFVVGVCSGHRGTSDER